jgi:hypothetical protein
MQQRWWLIAVVVVGIGLAILLVPRPDTGEIPEAPPEVKPVPAAPAPRAKPDKADILPGPPPGAEKVIAQRNRPSAKASRELAAPLGAIRYALRRVGTEASADLSARVKEVQQKFADHTTDVEGDLDDIIAEFAPLLEEIKGSYSDDPDIQASIERYEAGVKDWNNSAQE